MRVLRDTRAFTPWLTVAALTGVGAILRFAELGRQSFWVDETVTAQLVEKSFADMLAALPGAESTPPLYYVLAWLWSRVAGADEAGLRSLSALAGVAVVPVGYGAARRLVSHRSGVIVAALAAVSPLLVWYSQEARSYSLFVLFGALSFLFFADALAEPSRRRLVLWAFSCGLVMATHYFGVFLVVAEATLLVHRHRRRATLVAIAGVAAAGAALLPLAAYQATHASSRWIRFIELRSRVEDAAVQLLVPPEPTIWAGAGVPEGHGSSWWVLGVVLLACAVGVVLVLGTRNERRGALVALAVGGATVTLPILMSLAAAVATGGRGDIFLYRNLVVAWLPLIVAVGAALGARRVGRPGLVAAGVLAVWSLAVVVLNASTPELQRDDWRLVTRSLGEPRGQIVLLSPSWQLAALQYYAPGLRELGDGASADEIVLLARTHVPSYSPAAETLRPPEGFELVERRELQNWVFTRFRARTRVYVPPESFEVSPAAASYVPLVRERPEPR